MSRVLFLFLIFLSALYGSNILSYNIYDRTDRVDVMLTFDTPYHGKILKSRNNSKIILKLYDVKIESSKIKHLSSHFLTTLSLNPMDGYTQVVATIPTSDIILKASKTADGYGLRLRFIKKSALETASQIKKNASKEQNKIFPNLPTKQANEIPTNYYIVIIILTIAVIVMLLLKRKVANLQHQQKSKGQNWLFKTPSPKTPTKKDPQNEDVSIRFQKRIDAHNSVVMIDFLDTSYLLLLGEHNNILLEKFQDNIPKTQGEFEQILTQKESELDTFLKVEQKIDKKENEKEDILRSFSKKASNISYDL